MLPEYLAATHQQARISEELSLLHLSCCTPSGKDLSGRPRDLVLRAGHTELSSQPREEGPSRVRKETSEGDVRMEIGCSQHIVSSSCLRASLACCLDVADGPLHRLVQALVLGGGQERPDRDRPLLRDHRRLPLLHHPVPSRRGRGDGGV